MILTVVAHHSVRATAESGAVWDDPSEDLLLDLVGAVERGDELFVVVERLADTDRQTYMQVLRNEDGSYLVEHREGAADRHFQGTTVDWREAHAVLVRWAFERPGWRESLQWEPM